MDQDMQGASLRNIYVRRRSGFRSQGWLMANGRPIRVAIGRSGILANKREGDGATPRGVFRLIRLWWRADRMPRPRTRLPVRRIGPRDGWCEDPKNRLYNRPIHVAESDGGDRLWRQDRLYDLIIELDHNTRPRVAGRGSAVFMHVARDGFLPTAGCVALQAPRLQKLLERIGPATRIVIE
jgi:L,D-peptidoglycan transpeptidase YkuD (ErfK/YbiS/YcfS/YnhG family)